MSETLQERINLIKSQLLSEYTIKVKNNWILECVAYLLSENPDVSNNELKNQVFEQFTLSNAQDSSNPVIPASVIQRKEPFTLNGIFVLQLLFLIDISESPYEQWRRLHNIELDDVQENRENKTFQSKKKRMFKLELSDGHKTIQGMEYSSIPCLNTKLNPGCKIQITGPVQVVNHILLLECKNVKILGGDVESFTIKNAYENVLLRALNKPESENPIKEYKEPSTAQEIAPFRQQQHVVPDLHANRREEDEILNGLKFDDDDDDLDFEALEKITEVENRFRMSQEDQTILKNLVDDDDDEIIEIPDVYYEIPPRPQNVNQMPVVANIVIEDNEEYVIPRRTVNGTPLRKIARIEPVRKATYTDDDYEFKTVHGVNFITIDQYLALKMCDRLCRDYAILASLEDFDARSLKILNSQWHVQGEISDEYSQQFLAVRFNNEIIEKLSGHKAVDLENMYKTAKTRPQIKSDIANIISNLQAKLTAETRFMRIQIKHSLSQDPSIVQIMELIDSHPQNSQAYSQKIIAENLQVVHPSTSDNE